ncbi:hypothetical protein WICPIJ_001128 [Wickerhamomyces pijperi]|uniref:F-box domain-containing protein n=1 Tax=Wickerhamomyces pijperi TaxID=599730 RepID=A0A9P8QCE6_WICPI|nr:hypothetical protein WICPIJ_001128 [Wickerhamomyces pijperi]
MPESNTLTLTSLPDELIQEIALLSDANDLIQLLHIPQIFASLREIIRIELPKDTEEFALIPSISRKCCKEIHWRKKLPRKYIYCIQINSAKELSSSYFQVRFPTINPAIALIFLNFKWDQGDKSHLGTINISRSIQTQFNRYNLSMLARKLLTNTTVYLGNQAETDKLNLDLEDSSFFCRETSKEFWERFVYLKADVKDLRITVEESEVSFFKNFFQYAENILYCKAKLSVELLKKLSISEKLHALELEDTWLNQPKEREEKRLRLDQDSTPSSSRINPGQLGFFSLHNVSFSQLKSLTLATSEGRLCEFMLPECLYLKIDFQSDTVPSIITFKAPELVVAQITYRTHTVMLRDVSFPNLKALLCKGDVSNDSGSQEISRAENSTWCFPQLDALQLSSVSQILSLSQETLQSLKQLQITVQSSQDILKVNDLVESCPNLNFLVTQSGDVSIPVWTFSADKHININTDEEAEEEDCSVEYGLFPHDIDNGDGYKEMAKHCIKTELNKFDNSYRRKSRMEIIDEKKNFFQRFSLEKIDV